MLSCMSCLYVTSIFHLDFCFVTCILAFLLPTFTSFSHTGTVVIFFFFFLIFITEIRD